MLFHIDLTFQFHHNNFYFLQHDFQHLDCQRVMRFGLKPRRKKTMAAAGGSVENHSDAVKNSYDENEMSVRCGITFFTW